MKKVLFIIVSLVMALSVFAKSSPVLAVPCETKNGRSGYCAKASACDTDKNDLIPFDQLPSDTNCVISGCCVPKSDLGDGQFTDLCSFAEGEGKEACIECITRDPPEIWTAIGCIPSTPNGFIQKLLPLGIGLGGGIAFLLMLFGALQIMTSAGNPEKLNAGKELITSAIVGLLLIIFSVFLLKLIGADILGIPNFK